MQHPARNAQLMEQRKLMNIVVPSILTKQCAREHFKHEFKMYLLLKNYNKTILKLSLIYPGNIFNCKKNKNGKPRRAPKQLFKMDEEKENNQCD